MFPSLEDMSVQCWALRCFFLVKQQVNPNVCVVLRWISRRSRGQGGTGAAGSLELTGGASLDSLVTASRLLLGCYN